VGFGGHVQGVGVQMRVGAPPGPVSGGHSVVDADAGVPAAGGGDRHVAQHQRGHRRVGGLVCGAAGQFVMVVGHHEIAYVVGHPADFFCFDAVSPSCSCDL
jgi:hypothetical protein